MTLRSRSSGAKVTRLPGFGDEDALDFLPNYPDMLLFSSDYPHQEGNPDSVNLYGPGLWELDDELRDRLLGRNAAEVFTEMGDPL
jgi:predicted TIM-barrel fold metal-dependent hydrolase